MTKLEQLRDIARRLEEASGLGWKIDTAIRLALNSVDVSQGTPPYTASIDAALGLVERVLPVSMWDMEYDPIAANRYQFFLHLEVGKHMEEAKAPTAPLAILRALFAALIAQEDANV